MSKIINLESGTKQRSFGCNYFDGAISVDGRLLFACPSARGLSVFALKGGVVKRVKDIARPSNLDGPGVVRCLCWSPLHISKGELLAVAIDTYVIIWKFCSNNDVQQVHFIETERSSTDTTAKTNKAAIVCLNWTQSALPTLILTRAAGPPTVIELRVTTTGDESKVVRTVSSSYTSQSRDMTFEAYTNVRKCSSPSIWGVSQSDRYVFVHNHAVWNIMCSHLAGKRGGEKVHNVEQIFPIVDISTKEGKLSQLKSAKSRSGLLLNSPKAVHKDAILNDALSLACVDSMLTVLSSPRNMHNDNATGDSSLGSLSAMDLILPIARTSISTTKDVNTSTNQMKITESGSGAFPHALSGTSIFDALSVPLLPSQQSNHNNNGIIMKAVPPKAIEISDLSQDYASKFSHLDAAAPTVISSAEIDNDGIGSSHGSNAMEALLNVIPTTTNTSGKQTGGISMTNTSMTTTTTGKGPLRRRHDDYELTILAEDGDILMKYILTGLDSILNSTTQAVPDIHCVYISEKGDQGYVCVGCTRSTPCSLSDKEKPQTPVNLMVWPIQLISDATTESSSSMSSNVPKMQVLKHGTRVPLPDGHTCSGIRFIEYKSNELEDRDSIHNSEVSLLIMCSKRSQTHSTLSLTNVSTTSIVDTSIIIADINNIIEKQKPREFKDKVFNNITSKHNIKKNSINNTSSAGVEVTLTAVSAQLDRMQTFMISMDERLTRACIAQQSSIDNINEKVNILTQYMCDAKKDG